MPRTQRPLRTCATEGCNNQFESSPNDYTVNCPEHRGRTIRVTRSQSQADFDKDYETGYREGYSDGKKRGDQPGFSGYRKAAFNYKHSKLSGYEAGFRDARNGNSARY